MENREIQPPQYCSGIPDHVTEGKEVLSYGIFYQMLLAVSEKEVVKGQGKTRVKVPIKFCWVNRKWDRERWRICCGWTIQSSFIVPRSNSPSATTMAVAPDTPLTENQPAHALPRNATAGLLSSTREPSWALCCPQGPRPCFPSQPTGWKGREQEEQLIPECLFVNSLSTTWREKNPIRSPHGGTLTTQNCWMNWGIQ